MTATATAPPPSRKRGPLGRLYHGETRIDFVRRTKVWFALSGALLLLSLGGLVFRHLNLGIEFEGGAVYEVPSETLSITAARDAVTGAGVGQVTVTELKSASGRRVRVATPTLAPDQAVKVQQAIATAAATDVDSVNRNEVSPSWGDEISRKALRALVVFLIVITFYITIRFEVKMAIPTLVALVHDVLVTVGVYALSGLEVTPATVVAVLTILGFSIYDGIVVFDKVHENTRLVSATGRMSYGDMVNLSLNQTLMRSINTSVTALIPIASLLVIGSAVLGATTLREFGLALLIGLASGAYSSIFVASPLLVILKEREPRYRDVRRRMDQRTSRLGDRTSEPAAEPVPDGEAAPEEEPVAASTRPTATSRSGTVIPPRPRKKRRR